jgi:hypothetical protein
LLKQKQLPACLLSIALFLLKQKQSYAEHARVVLLKQNHGKAWCGFA